MQGMPSESRAGSQCASKAFRRSFERYGGWSKRLLPGCKVFQYSRSATGNQSWFAPLGPGTDGLGKLYWGVQTYIQGLDRIVPDFSEGQGSRIGLADKNKYFGLV